MKKILNYFMKNKTSTFKFKTKDSKFGKRAICPVCGKDYYLQGIKQHIINAGKGELWRRELIKSKKTPHLDFVKKNADTIETTKFLFHIFRAI